jgi:hypothetical protein
MRNPWLLVLITQICLYLEYDVCFKLFLSKQPSKSICEICEIRVCILTSEASRLVKNRWLYHL